MNIAQTGFQDLFVLEPAIFEDERGFFMESYNFSTLQKKGIDVNFVQDNQSFSKKGVLRGLHFQKGPFAQTKLVRSLTGAIVDVVVDLRSNQPTFKKTFSVELSAENNKQLLIPKGFAHGFLVVSETANVLYKCDEYYNKSAEAGIRFDDPELDIDWIFPKENLIVSAKDKELPFFSNLNFKF
jgi:dTDP-4-dehydrorhamnose 3,5-epimerase